MPVLPDLSRAQIRIGGPDFEPPGPEWRWTTPDQRRGYWREVAVLSRDEVYRQLHKGIGANGEKLPPRRRPRRDHANGPVLSPHWSDSRFRTELRWQGTPDGAVLWWRSPWGRIVGYHARGEVRGAPARNVIGITVQGQERVKKKAAEWWASQVRTGRMGTGVTMLGNLPMAAGAEGLTWRRSPPPRKPGGFSPVPPAPRFVLSGKSKERGDILVRVDLSRLLADVGPELQQGMRPTSLEAVRREVQSGTVMAPRIGVTRTGAATVIDGRHRLTALRERGVVVVKVAVDPGEAQAIRARYGIAEPLPAVPPPLVPPPHFSRFDRPWDVIQKLSAWWSGSWRGLTREADIARILDRMDRNLPLADLIEVVARFGVREVPKTKVRALELIGMNLRERFRSVQSPWIR